MRKFLLSLLMVMSFVYTQTPIIRLMQSREYNTPKYWWGAQENFKLRGFLADDTTGLANPTNGTYKSKTRGVAYKNNNFDAWRDSVMTIAVTLDDNDADVTAFRLDLVFDNDLIDWTHDSTHVEKGAYINGWTEGDSAAAAHYSYEVVRYADVGYADSLAAGGTQDTSKSITDARYDWLRITMVSHNGNTHTFGNGDSTQTELLKLHFRIKDVVDNFSAKSFRVATKYLAGTGYYTYVTNGNYLTTYQVYIDGNTGQDGVGIGGARGDITLHPKLVDVEGYLRYVQGKGRAVAAAFTTATDNTYPYWKIKFELDQSNPHSYSNWYNIESITDATTTTETNTTDDVIGNYQSGAPGYFYLKKTTIADQVVPAEGFLGISYYDSTYTDSNGYYNIQLPRNNGYRMSFWPPDASDDIENHVQLELDRNQITNVTDAIMSFNFQSGKHHNYNSGGGRIDTLNSIEYFIGDVDGDDLFQLNDTYILWSYVSGIMNNYTHHNGNSYEDWSTIDTFHVAGTPTARGYYQTLNGQSRLQKYEFTVFEDGDFNQAQALTYNPIETLNPLMDDVITGLDTIHYNVGAGTSTWHADKVTNDANPDYTIDSLSYFFTGDINTTGTKVGSDAYQTQTNTTTYYRWGAVGNAPANWNQKINIGDNTPGILSKSKNVDVILSLPADSTVRVQSGNQIEVPLTITPRAGVLISGFEFEVEFDTTVLHFIDMKTDILPGPWMTYVNVHEPVNNWQRVSFGGVDYSPSNAPERYWIDKEIVGLNLVFEAAFPDTEWTQAPINFIGKHAAGTPAGRDLTMSKSDGEVWVWNKYWAFGGGKPDEEAITYNYPNPFIENTKFQFFLDEPKDVQLYILNSIGQRIGTLLNEHVLTGLHTFDFTNEPTVWLPDVSVYENHQKLEPGVYIFVMQTDNRIKANKFTVVK